MSCVMPSPPFAPLPADEPYEETELPVGKYKEDKSYGDRRYENGEVFYKDAGTGSFYRQGSRPRQKKFWDLNSS